MWKQFSVCICDTLSYTTNVFINSHSNLLPKTPMQKYAEGLYKVQVLLPQDYNESIQYWYEYIGPDGRIFVDRKSDHFHLGEASLRRDIICHSQKSSRRDGVFVHLMDILKECASDPQAMCNQIEDVLVTTLCPFDASCVVGKLCNEAEISSPAVCLSIAVIIGKSFICDEHQIHALDFLSSHMADMILVGLEKYRLNVLPSSCSEYLPHVCRCLCKLCLGTNYGWITYLNRCYPFYSEEMLYTYLSDYINSKHNLHIMSRNDLVQKHAIQLCGKFRDKLFGQESKEAEQLLKMILTYCPLETTIDFFELSEKPDPKSIAARSESWTTINDIVSVRIDMSLNMAKAIDSILDISHLWKKIQKAPKLVEIYRGPFSKEIIESLRQLRCQSTENVYEILTDICTNSTMFLDKTMQVQLLEVLAKSLVPQVHQTFIKIASIHPINASMSAVGEDAFLEWFKNDVLVPTPSKGNAIILLYKRYDELVSIPSVIERHSVTQQVGEFMSKKLNEYDIEEVLQVHQMIDDMTDGDTSAKCLYIEQAQRMLTDTSIDPYKALKSLCSTDGDTLTVDSKVTAALVASILTTADTFPNEVPEAFNVLVTGFHFWNLILNVKGKHDAGVKCNETFIKALVNIRKVLELLRKHDLKYKYIKQLQTQGHYAKQLLIFGNSEEAEINRLCDESAAICLQEQEKVFCVENVLEQIRVNVGKNYLPDGFDELLDQVKHMVICFGNGDISAKQCMSKDGLWEDMADLQDICGILQKAASSRIFWNSIKDEISKKVFLSKLDGCDISLDGKTAAKDTKLILIFLRNLQNSGHKLYQKAWSQLQAAAGSLLDMIPGADLSAEIASAESYFGQNSNVQKLLLTKSRMDLRFSHAKNHFDQLYNTKSKPVCSQYTAPVPMLNIPSNEESNIDYPPFLNVHVFENQYLRFSDINKMQEALIEKVKSWVHGVCETTEKHFTENDTFPVYNDDLIASLLLHLNKELPDLDDDDIITKCQTELLWIIKPEAVIRLCKATHVEIRESVDDIQRKYFSLPVHRGITGLIHHQFEDNLMPDSKEGESLMTVVFTSSNIHTKVNLNITDKKVQIDKLGSFKPEKQLSLRMQKFWLETDCDILFLQCSAVDDDKHIMLSKSVIERYRNEYLSKRPCSSSQKHVYLVIHIDRNKGIAAAVSQINYLSEWKLVMLDSLECPVTPLPQLWNSSLTDIIMRRPLEPHIKEQLFWAFTRIKYESIGRDVESIITIADKSSTTPEFLRVLGEQIFYWIKDNREHIDDVDWQINVACDMQALQTSSCFVGALERHILNVVNVPLSKTIYQMENKGIIDSFFVQERKGARREVWRNLLNDIRIFSINDIPNESGPECYQCTTADLALKMPFSKYIFECTEATREEFLETLTLLKGTCELEGDEDLPKEIVDELLLKQEHFLLEKLPELTACTYDSWEDDYIDDFCNISSFSTCSNLPNQKRIQYMKWAVSQKADLCASDPLKLLLHLHTALWIHSDLFHSELQLLEICCDVISDDNDDLLQTLRDLEPPNETDPVTHDEVKEDGYIPEVESTKALPLYSLSKSVGDENEEAIQSDEEQTINYLDESIHSSPVPELAEDMHESVADDNTNTEREVYNSMSSTDTHSRVSPPNTNTDEVSVVSEHPTLPDEDNDSISQELTSQDLLVELVCRKMLSTSATLDTYNGIQNWQRKINCVLAIAARVSTHPASLHSLRFCNDMVSSLFIPYSLNATLLQNVGNLLGEKVDLDSEHIFLAIKDIVSDAPSTARSDCQKILVNYCLRCLTSNPSSLSIAYLLRMVSRSEMPDNVFHMKSPLQLVFLYEMDDDEDTFLNLIHADSSSETVAESTLFGLLESFLDDIKAQNQLDSPCVVVLIDILEDMYSDILQQDQNDEDGEDIEEFGYGVSDLAEMFLQSHYTLTNSKFGLNFVASLAFCKAYIRCIFDQIDETQDVQADVFSAAFTDQHHPLIFTLMQYVYKVIAMDKLHGHFIKACDQLGEQLPFLKAVEWNANYATICFDACPTAVHAPVAIKEVIVLFNESIDDIDIDNTMEKLIKNAVCKGGSQEMMAVYSFAINKFYIRRCFEIADDTMNTLARCILQLARDSHMETKKEQLLRCLVGKVDFDVSNLMLKESSSPSEAIIASFLISLYTVLLSYTAPTAHGKQPVLVECLLHTSIKGHHLPGFPDNEYNHSTFLKQRFPSKCYFTVCSCGHRLTATTISESTKCVICGTILAFEESPCVDNTESTEIKPGYIMCDEINRPDFSARGLGPALCNVLGILVKGCILGSVALGFMPAHILEKETGLPELDGPHMIWADIENHWQNLENLLNMDMHGVGMLLHTVVLHTREFLTQDVSVLISPKDRLTWEGRFTSQATPILNDRFQLMKKVVSRHNAITGCSVEAIENNLHEFNDLSTMDHDKRQSVLPTLFRVKGCPSMENFLFELNASKESFPFLVLTLEHEEDLQLCKHILSIVRWHVAATANANYLMKKQECLTMTVSDFIHKSHEKDKIELLKNRFDAFKESWETVRKHVDMKVFDIEDLEMKRVNAQANVSECLVLNDDSVVYKVLQLLVEKQNKFLDRTLELAYVCSSVMFLRREEDATVIPCVQICDIKKEDLIHFEWDDMYLQQFAQCDTMYGQGQTVLYDFQTIERKLTLDVIVGKAYIGLENNLPKIMFKDELYKNYSLLVKELKSKVKQSPLTNEIIAGVKTKKECDPSMTTNLLTHLGIVMTLLKKNPGDPYKTLVDFVDEWKNVSIHKLPPELLPSPVTAVKLTHLVALHELLEELNSDTVRESLDERFREEIDVDTENHFKRPAFKSHQPAVVLKTVKIFIHRCLYLGDVECNQPLNQYLSDESFWPDGVMVENGVKLGDAVIPLKTVIPDEVMVGHVYNLVELMENAVEQQTERNLKMTKIASGFKSQNKTSTVSKVGRKKRSAKKMHNF